jgi:hypothetical protein
MRRTSLILMELNQPPRPNCSKDFMRLLAFSVVNSSLLIGMNLNA